MAIVTIEEAARQPCKAGAHDVEVAIIAAESHSGLYFKGGFLECWLLRYQKLEKALFSLDVKETRLRMT